MGQSPRIFGWKIPEIRISWSSLAAEPKRCARLDTMTTRALRPPRPRRGSRWPQRAKWPRWFTPNLWVCWSLIWKKGIELVISKWFQGGWCGNYHINGCNEGFTIYIYIHINSYIWLWIIPLPTDPSTFWVLGLWSRRLAVPSQKAFGSIGTWRYCPCHFDP